MQYRTDIEYIASFNPRQAPPVMNYVAALNGFSTIDLQTSFRYCDLGCGPGTTILTMAAAFPHSQFWGIDLNENHVRMSRSRAEKSGLTNIKFIHSDFINLSNLELPKFHFTAISGTLSWLAEQPRDAVLDFMGNQLEGGGLTYLHYMVMPGHANQPPLCRLASDYYHQLEGEVEERVLLTKEFMKGFLNTQKRYFEISPPSKDFVQQMVNASTSLFLHDYLSNVRTAYYFDDMNKFMEQRGMRYAGSAEYFYNHLQLVVPIESRELFRGVRERAGVEAIKDFIGVSGGRTDIFCKTTQAAGHEAPLENVLLGAVPLQNSPQAVNFPGLTLRLNVEPIASVLRILEKPGTLADLYAHVDLAAYPRHEIRKNLTYAVALKRIIPLSIANDPPQNVLSAYNLATLNHAIQSSPDVIPSVTLASQVMGNGHSISWIDAVMVWSLLSAPQEAPQKVANILQQRNLSIKVQASNSDRELTPEESMQMALQNASRQFAPILEFMGIATIDPKSA